MDTGFSLEHLKEKDHLEDLCIYLRINTRVILRKLDRDCMDWINTRVILRKLDRDCMDWINTRMILRKLDRDCMDWIHLLQDRNKYGILVNKIMNTRFP